MAKKKSATITIDQRKFAAFIRHFGVKLKGEEGAYMLSIPLHVWAQTPKNTRVIPADDPGHGRWPPNPKVQFVTFMDSEG